ncbi:MAG: GTPase RsgA, partial [Bdellovibrionota bacterium]
MSPKFRGNSDDWLDDQGPSRGDRDKKKPTARSRFLLDAEGNARIAEVFPKQARVILDEGGASLVCGYKRAAIFGTSDVRERAPVAVGDHVVVKATSSSTGIIEGLCERTTFLFRPAPDRGEGETIQVIVSNIDRLVIVASAENPEFSPGIVDRYLVAAQA